ncbi:endodeoxyribonuclease [Blomia tropicalis]|nr:endodeoxyribonuclease [Blomia tropicalis]
MDDNSILPPIEPLTESEIATAIEVGKLDYSENSITGEIAPIKRQIIPIYREFRNFILRNDPCLQGNSFHIESLIILKTALEVEKRSLIRRNFNLNAEFSGCPPIIFEFKFKNKRHFVPKFGYFCNTLLKEKNLSCAEIDKYIAFINFIMQCLQSHKLVTISEIRTNFPNESFDDIDERIQNLCVTLKTPKSQLNIVELTSSLMFGSISFVDFYGFSIKGEMAVPVPIKPFKLTNVSSCATFILIVQCKKTFLKLINLKIDKYFNLIMFTGVSDWPTTVLIQQLSLIWQIPVFVLTDFNLEGLNFASSFRYGSSSPSYEALQMNVPYLRWLGIHFRDVRDFNLECKPSNHMPEDFEEPFAQFAFNPKWQEQIDAMRRFDHQSYLYEFIEKRPKFFISHFLPYKIYVGKGI